MENIFGIANLFHIVSVNIIIPIFNILPESTSQFIYRNMNSCFDSLAFEYLYWNDIVKYYIKEYFPKTSSVPTIKKIILHYYEETPKNIEITNHLSENHLNNNKLINIIETLKNANYDNIKMDEVQHLEIIYYQGDETYRIIYDKKDNIIFPPYQSDDITSHNVIDNYQNGILFATYNDKDITELLKEYAGPKGNFYHDKDILVTMDKMKYALNIFKYNHDDKHELIITDNYALDHTFENDDPLLLDNLV